MNEWMGRWMDRWMDGWVGRCGWEPTELPSAMHTCRHSIESMFLFRVTDKVKYFTLFDASKTYSLEIHPRIFMIKQQLFLFVLLRSEYMTLFDLQPWEWNIFIC